MWSIMALVYIRRLHVERDRRGRRGRDGEGEWCGVRVDSIYRGETAVCCAYINLEILEDDPD
mgnify:CR=1 FL=1